MKDELFEKAEKLYNDDNLVEAIKYYELALEAGNSKAAFELGRIYEEIDEVKDIKKSISMHELGIKLGCFDSLNELARIYFERKEYKKYLDLIEIEYFEIIESQGLIIPSKEYYLSNSKIMRVLEKYTLEKKAINDYEEILCQYKKFINNNRIRFELINVMPEIYKKWYLLRLKKQNDFHSICNEFILILEDIEKENYLTNYDDLITKFKLKSSDLLTRFLNTESFSEYLSDMEKLYDNTLIDMESRIAINCINKPNLKDIFDLYLSKINDKVENYYITELSNCHNIEDIKHLRKIGHKDKYGKANSNIIQMINLKHDDICLRNVNYMLDNFNDIKEYDDILKSIELLLNEEIKNDLTLKLDLIMCKSYTLGLNGTRKNLAFAKKYYKHIEMFRLFLYEIVEKEFQNQNEDEAKHILSSFGFDIKKLEKPKLFSLF